MTRAILDSAPNEVARVTTYFYGKDLSSYQEVTVSAGDIKAFASGQMSNEQLLASLVVKSGSTGQQSETEKVSAELQSAAIPPPSEYMIAPQKDGITVTSNLDPWVSDEEARLEALRIATNAFHAQKDALTIKVIFTDPSYQAESREFVFLTERLGPIWNAIQNAVGSVSVVRKTVSVQSMRTLKGPEQEGRDALLVQLKDMDKKGIGVAPFTKAFLLIEQAAKRETDGKYIAEMVKALKGNIDDQMKSYTRAKESKPAPVADNSPPVTTQAKDGGKDKHVPSSLGDLASIPKMDGEILADPSAYVAKFESTRPKAQDLLKVLNRVANLLYANNRAAEAKKFQVRANQLAATLPHK
jgi:hypothetical protein